MFELYDNVYFIDAEEKKVNKGMIKGHAKNGSAYYVSTVTADGETGFIVRQVFKSFDAAFASLHSTLPPHDDIIKRYIAEWNAAIAENGKLTTATLCEQLQIGVHVTLLDEDINPSVEMYAVRKHGRLYLVSVPTAMINCSDILDDHEQIVYLGTASFFEPSPKKAKRG